MCIVLYVVPSSEKKGKTGGLKSINSAINNNVCMSSFLEMINQSRFFSSKNIDFSH